MKKLYILLIAVLSLASCESFVDIVPKGQTIPTTVDNFGDMMNNGSIAMGGDDYAFTDICYSVNFIEFLSDDFTAPDNPSSVYYSVFKNNAFVYNTIVWNKEIWSAADADQNWDGLYKSNYVANFVLDNIDTAEPGVSYTRETVKARALVHRAFNYFELVNLYGKQYNAATASTDPGVPLVLESNINNQYLRATVAEVYAQILKDLDLAIELFDNTNPTFNNLPGKATAYALRARTYLWMQDYDKAYADATASLQLRSTLIDYNTLFQYMPGIPAYGIGGYDTNRTTNPEILYLRYKTESLLGPYSDKLVAITDQANDLRWTTFMGALEMSGIMETVNWTRIINGGINISEVWLTKAEAALRKSSPDVTEALAALNHLRRHRYAAATFQPVTTTNPDQLLTEILNERRRELVYTDLSFLNKKRLNADPKTAQDMTRSIYGNDYKMPVGDPRWQLLIPYNVMDFNPQMVQNER